MPNRPQRSRLITLLVSQMFMLVVLGLVVAGCGGPGGGGGY